MIYLDNAATTIMLPEVLAVSNKYMTQVYGNPSSSHKYGLDAKKAVDISAKIIAKELNIEPEKLIFTSGATESNNTAILQAKWIINKRKRHFITTKVEHPSVRNCFLYLEKLGHDVTFLEVDENGLVTAENVLAAVRDNTELISIVYANNEIGTINPLPDIVNALRQAGYQGEIHTDATQALCKLAIDLKAMDLDYLSASGHKVHAPKGVGLLYTKKQKIEPFVRGGSHQDNRRAGTLNVAGIASFAKAISLLSEQRLQHENRYKELGKIIEEGIDFEALDGKMIASKANRLSNIYCLGFKHIKSEVVLNAFSAEGIMISSGSACSSTSKKLSHVVEAIKLDKEYQDGVVRVSFSVLTTKEEVEEFVRVTNRIIPRLQKVTR